MLQRALLGEERRRSTPSGVGGGICVSRGRGSVAEAAGSALDPGELVELAAMEGVRKNRPRRPEL